MGWFKRSWNGEEELWKVVWIYGILLIFLGEAACIALRIFTGIDPDSPHSGAGRFLNYFALLYSVWLLVCLWRCAVNAEWDGWRYLVRAVVILYVLVFGYLSYTQHRLLSPKDVFSMDGIKLLQHVSKWLFDHAIALVRSIRVRA